MKIILLIHYKNNKQHSKKKIIQLKVNIYFQKNKSVYQNYLHSYQTRSESEIQKTTKYILKLSTQNLERLSKVNLKQIQLKENKQKFKDILFVCISGIPPIPKQFDFLQLPGQYYHFVAMGFQSNLNDQQRIKAIPNCRFQVEADRLHKIIQESKKSIVFIYHSFGTYILSSYLNQYGYDKVVGMIEFGAAPIRHYRYITQVGYFASKYTEQDLIEKTEQVIGKDFTQFIIRLNKQFGISWDLFPSSSFGACFISYFKSGNIQILFDLNRRYPNILKLMLFGQEDNLFEIDLLSERCQFYSLQQLQNQSQLKKKFNKIYGVNVQNIQQKFIFMIPKGKHSLHMQKKFKQLINKSVHEYLYVKFCS